MDDNTSSGMMQTTSMQKMEIVFFAADNTPLYSSSWRPNSVGTYAGTCIFLIILAVIFRLLFAWKAVLERRWLAKTRRWNLVASENTKEGRTHVSTLRPGQTNSGWRSRLVVPFRLSIDVPRALLFTVIFGIGYLLMLAVMTLNVGYFISVLAGGFLGELLFGRYSSATDSPEGHLC